MKLRFIRTIKAVLRDIDSIGLVKAALLGGLFFFSAFSQAGLPEFKVTTTYAAPILAKGSVDEINRYNKWVSDPSLCPSFAQEAVLDFGERKVRVFLIGSTHGDRRDVAFIEEALEKFGLDPNKSTLFIEQGDEALPGGGAVNLDVKIHSSVPELIPALDQAARAQNSILNPDFTRGLVFATVARDWTSRGGHFINFDAASNFSDEAFAFFRANLDAETAVRIIREELFGVTFNWNDFSHLLTKGYGFSGLEKIRDCCSTLKDWVPWELDDNQVRNLVRERYMRLILSQGSVEAKGAVKPSGLKDGDVVVTHPVHLRNLLAPERTDGYPP